MRPMFVSEDTFFFQTFYPSLNLVIILLSIHNNEKNLLLHQQLSYMQTELCNAANLMHWTVILGFLFYVQTAALEPQNTFNKYPFVGVCEKLDETIMYGMHI